jgi:hypothetical protein
MPYAYDDDNGDDGDTGDNDGGDDDDGGYVITSDNNIKCLRSTPMPYAYIHIQNIYLSIFVDYIYLNRYLNTYIIKYL